MSVLQRVACWLAPSRDEEIQRADRGVADAKARLKEVRNQTRTVETVMAAHHRDRLNNHYGERILYALKGLSQ